jgi:serine O-acetyltransferase
VSVEDPTSDARAGEQQLRPLKRRLSRLWLFSPERLWLLSISLQRTGRWRLAFAVKQLNTVLYHNSLSPRAIVSSDIALGHYSHGIVVNGNVEIGEQVKIWHNVTLTAGRPPRRDGKRVEGPPARIVIEDSVKIGTNAVVIAPRGQCLRIGRGARLGAGVVVTQDVPARATVVSPPARILLRDAQPADADADADADGDGFGDADAGRGVADVRLAGSGDAALDAPPASTAGEDAGAAHGESPSQP